MITLLLRVALIVVLWSGLPEIALGAEGALVDKIIEITEGTPISVKTSDRVFLQTGMNPSWKTVSVRDGVGNLDFIKLKRNTLLGLKFRSADQRADVILTEELKNTTFVVNYQGDTVYQMVEGGIEIVSGSLVIKWLAKPFKVIACGIVHIISGTSPAKVAFITDGDIGTVIVEEGIARFPAYPDIELSAGEAAQLRRGQPPLPFFARPYMDAGVSQVISASETTVWPPGSILTKPYVIIPAGLAVAAVVGLIIIDGDDSAEGTVIIATH